MGFNLSKIGTKTEGKSKPRGLPKKGTQLGRLVEICDLGVRVRPAYKGQAKDPCRQIEMLFELPNDRMEYEDKEGNTDSLPRWVSTKSINVFEPATRGRMVELKAGMDPDNLVGDDIGQLLGDAFLISITHDIIGGGVREGQETYNISSVVLPPEGIEVPALENEPRLFLFDEPDKDVFKSFPEWKRAKLKDALNYVGSPLEAVVAQAELELAQEVGDKLELAEKAPVAKTEKPAVKRTIETPAPSAVDAPEIGDGDIPF